MGFGWKAAGGGGGVWWLLPLAAGVLLLLASSAATAAAAAEEGGNGNNIGGCYGKCDKIPDQRQREICRSTCRLWAPAAAVGAGSGGVEEELGGSQHMCEIKCQHHKNPENRQRCINYCIKYQLAAVAGVEEEDEAAAAAAAGAIRQVV